MKKSPRILINLIDDSERVIKKEWIELSLDVIDSWAAIASFIDSLDGEDSISYFDYIVTDYENFGCKFDVKENITSMELDEILEQL